MDPNQKEDSTFVGTGYRLGSTPNMPSQPIVSQKKGEPPKKMIYLWKNGFSIDDGPLRNYNDPDSVQFFQYINKG